MPLSKSGRKKPTGQLNVLRLRNVTYGVANKRGEAGNEKVSNVSVEPSEASPIKTLKHDHTKAPPIAGVRVPVSSNDFGGH